jgi:hypothetical protein
MILSIFEMIILKLTLIGRFSGVVVIVLATGPKGCGFDSVQGYGFLRAITIRSTPSFRMGSKAGVPMS